MGNGATGANATITLTNTGLGGTANPALSITKNNATAGFIYEPKIIIGRNVLQNEELYRMSVLGNTSTLANQEFARMEVTSSNVGASNNDGTIDFWASINGTISEVFRMNGADNENNSFRPLDMNGQDIKTSSGNMTISTASSTGTGTITITPKQNQSILITSPADPTLDFISIQPALAGFTDANRILLTNTENASSIKSSIDLLNIKYNPLIELKADFGGAINKSIQIHADGTTNFNKITAYDGQSNNPFQIDTSGYTNGSLEIKPNDTTGDIIFTGSNLQASVSTGVSGQYLRIKLNGTYYKIVLEND